MHNALTIFMFHSKTYAHLKQVICSEKHPPEELFMVFIVLLSVP